MSALPLEGIRVADFSWFGAGPIGDQMETAASELAAASRAKMPGQVLFIWRHARCIAPAGTCVNG